MGKRADKRRAARQKRVETRQAGKTERAKARASGGGGFDADEALDTLGNVAGAVADKGLLGAVLGGAGKADDDDDDNDPLGAAMATADDDDDEPTLTGDPVEWAKKNPGKAAGGAAAVALGGRLLKIW